MSVQESRSVWRRLPIDQIDEVEADSGVGKLTRSLGLWQLTAIGVGGIIGGGIFSAVGDVGAVRDLAPHRARDLRRLRPQALAAQPRQPAPPVDTSHDVRALDGDDRRQPAPTSQALPAPAKCTGCTPPSR